MSTTPAITDQQLIQAGQAYMAAACSGTASQAVAAMRAVLCAQAEQREAIGYMSPAQLPAIRDVEDLAGAYIPMRKTPGGMFTLALYTAPPAVQAQALADMEARKDAAYLERNQVVAALAKAYPSGVARTAIEGWSEDWHGCVYIDLPTGQASWHFHDSQAYLFADLPPYAGKWDGHDTPEKYRRLAALTVQAAPVALAETEVEFGLNNELEDPSDDETTGFHRGVRWAEARHGIGAAAQGGV